jgi:hypothetical protein
VGGQLPVARRSACDAVQQTTICHPPPNLNFEFFFGKMLLSAKDLKL